jgi:hypothetical protein
MKLLEFLQSTLKLSCMLLMLSGCAPIVTAPITALPLIFISVVLLIPAPSLDQHWRTAWETLTTALLAQAILFGMFVSLGTALELEKIAKHLTFRQGLVAALQLARKQPLTWAEVKGGLRRLIIFGLVTLLPPIFLAGILHLWRQGQQTWANLLLLPFLLLLVSPIVVNMSSSSRRRKPSRGTRYTPPRRSFTRRQGRPAIDRSLLYQNRHRRNETLSEVARRKSAGKRNDVQSQDQ